MHHLAIMKKSWNLTQEIGKGNKTIESRWYQRRTLPWNKLNISDQIYFKDSGNKVTAKAEIEKIIQIELKNPHEINEILKKYWKEIIVDKSKLPELKKHTLDKKYCILIFLKNNKFVKPFEINKKGFPLQQSWITIENIKQIKIKDE